MGAVKVRNTTVNGGMTGRDKTINKVFAYRDGKSYSQMKRFGTGSAIATPSQQLIRDTFSQTSIGWSNLSESDREAWNNAAPDWINTNVFGNKSQSGKNLYTGANVALVGAGRDIISEPLRKNLIASPEEASVIWSAGVLTAIVPFFVTEDTDTCQIRVSKQKTAGTSKNSQYVTLVNVNCGANITQDLSTPYQAKYGDFVSGSKIFVEIRLVSAGGNNTLYLSEVVTVP